MISIVIPTYNHLEDFLIPCLQSIKRHTDLSQVEVIVVANGCKDNTRAYVEALGAPFKLVWFDEGLGFTKATNEGIKVAQGEYVILLNNDTVLLDQRRNMWIEMLLAPFKHDPTTGLSGPHYLFDTHVGSEFIVFFCVMIHRDVFKTIGLLDEIFSPGSGEDIDFCMRAKARGFRVAFTGESTADEVRGFNTGDFPIWHVAEGTFGTYPGWREIFDRNSKILMDRKLKGYYNEA